MSRPSGRTGRTQRFWVVVRSVTALLVLFAIAGDILADSRCHAPELGQVGPSVWASALSTDQDPCGTGCVPDCYCCSQSLTCGPAVLPLGAGLKTLTRDVLPVAGPAGVRPVPYRPPLDLV